MQSKGRGCKEEFCRKPRKWTLFNMVAQPWAGMSPRRWVSQGGPVPGSLRKTDKWASQPLPGGTDDQDDYEI